MEVFIKKSRQKLSSILSYAAVRLIGGLLLIYLAYSMPNTRYSILVLVAMTVVMSFLFKWYKTASAITTSSAQFAVPTGVVGSRISSQELSRAMETKLLELTQKYGTSDINDPMIKSELQAYMESLVKK